MRARSTLCLTLLAVGVVLRDSHLGAHGAANCVAVIVTNQPQSQSVLENCPVTFTVGVMGTSPFSYQWFHDGTRILGATNSSYTIPHVLRRDSGVRVHATIANACSQAISSEAQLNVSLDVVPPRLLRARGDASLERVIVTFAVGGCAGFGGLDAYSARERLNYSFTGGIIASNAQLQSDGTNVILTTTRQNPNTVYMLRVEGVSDWAGNIIPSGSETTFQSWLVLAGTDPKVVPPPVSLFRSGPDIWITWPYGSFLQSADDVAGPWRTLLNADFPYRVTADGTGHFYRALSDP
jgi:hypothetical protein